MLALVGIAVLAIGFLLRLNPLLIVILAALATGIAVGRDPAEIVAAYGKAFNDNRYVRIAWLVLPVIGLLERSGLQERARQIIGGVRGATTGRLLFVYFVARQLTAALGLLTLGGHAQMVRRAPVVEAAAETRFGRLPDHNGAELWRRLRGAGFPGSQRAVSEWATRRHMDEVATQGETETVLPAGSAVLH